MLFIFSVRKCRRINCGSGTSENADTNTNNSNKYIAHAKPIEYLVIFFSYILRSQPYLLFITALHMCDSHFSRSVQVTFATSPWATVLKRLHTQMPQCSMYVISKYLVIFAVSKIALSAHWRRTYRPF